jgi:hypothetical protein
MEGGMGETSLKKYIPLFLREPIRFEGQRHWYLFSSSGFRYLDHYGRDYVPVRENPLIVGTGDDTREKPPPD